MVTDIAAVGLVNVILSTLEDTATALTELALCLTMVDTAVVVEHVTVESASASLDGQDPRALVQPRLALV